jgi:hypothetical protein
VKVERGILFFGVFLSPRTKNEKTKKKTHKAR